MARRCCRKEIVGATLLLALAGCASFSPEELAEWRDVSQNTRIVCRSSAQCAHLWSRARQWAFANAPFGIRIATDDLIETRGPPRTKVVWRYRVIRSREANGSERIRLERSCTYNVLTGMTECDELFVKADASFKRHVLELD